MYSVLPGSPAFFLFFFCCGFYCSLDLSFDPSDRPATAELGLLSPDSSEEDDVRDTARDGRWDLEANVVPNEHGNIINNC